MKTRGVARNYCAARIAVPGDAAGINTLLRSSYPTLMASAYDEAVLALALKLMTRANMSLLRSGTYYVVESRGGLVVGCGGWTLERPDTATVEANLGHLRHFGTHPAWACRGVGRAIYSLCESSARSVGVTTFECYSSLNAEKFYSALGFESIRRIRLELGPTVGLPGVLMRLANLTRTPLFSGECLTTALETALLEHLPRGAERCMFAKLGNHSLRSGSSSVRTVSWITNAPSFCGSETEQGKKVGKTRAKNRRTRAAWKTQSKCLIMCAFTRGA